MMCGGPAVNGPLGPFPKDITASVRWKNLSGQRREFARSKKIGGSTLSVSHHFSLSFPTFSLL